jgi:hypothetical protein
MGNVHNSDVIESGSPGGRPWSTLLHAVAIVGFSAALSWPSLAQTPPAPEAKPAPTAPAPASPAAPATPDKPAAAAPAGETPATVIDGQKVESLLGKNVESASGEDMGRIVDILAEKNGQMRAAIIDFGGFFGVGSRKIAVDWRSLRFPAEGSNDKVVVDLPRNQLRVAPVYKEGEPVVVLGPGPAAPGGGGGAQAPAATPQAAPVAPAPATGTAAP